MTFSYYRKLSRRSQQIYRVSDAIHGITVPRCEKFQPLIPRIARALEREDRPRVQQLCGTLAKGIARELNTPPVRVKVLAVRPSASWGELHGLYEPVEGRAQAVISLWMRTAKHKRIVAFRSFLRTLLHELGHHLDYEHFRLRDSFHTEGFYKRESSLFHQLVPERQQGGKRKARQR